MSVNGYLKIKTKIDNSEIPKGVQDLENKIKKVQTENSKLSKEERGLQEEVNAYKKLQVEADKYNQKLKELKAKKQEMFNNNKNLAVGTDTSEYAKVKADIDNINMKYKQTVAEIDKQFSKMEKIHSKLDKIKSKQNENNDKISQYKLKIESIKTQHIENSINNVGKSLSNQISKISKMALGIIGISTAWGAVRSAISLVSQYNSQVATDIDYMKYALANALAPIVQKLISMAFTLLSYLNAITTAWFGINLFSNSTAKNFQKMKKSASSTAKSAKEIQKSLQGFDEMNVLQDNSGKGNSGNTGGGTSNIPSMDLSSMQIETPAWLQWIIDNKDLILQILAGVVAGILAIKLGLTGIQALGIGLAIAGIVGLISSLIAYLNDPSWENFGKIISNIGLIILGLGLIIGNVPLIVAGAIMAIVGLIVSNWESIKSKLEEGIEWLKSKTDWVRENFRNFRRVYL